MSPPLLELFRNSSVLALSPVPYKGHYVKHIWSYKNTLVILHYCHGILTGIYYQWCLIIIERKQKNRDFKNQTKVNELFWEPLKQASIWKTSRMFAWQDLCEQSQHTKEEQFHGWERKTCKDRGNVEACVEDEPKNFRLGLRSLRGRQRWQQEVSIRDFSVV